MSNTIGRLFRLTTFGESHGKSIGAVVDGCPPGLELTEADIQPQLNRRRPGQSSITTPRAETDTVQILSGVENGITLGSPVALAIENLNISPKEYKELENIPRPSHADFTYRKKYGITASSGGGRASARETVGRVAGGAIAEKFLRITHSIDITAWVSAVGTVQAPDMTEQEIRRSDVDRSEVRCPSEPSAADMIKAIKAAIDSGDSLGGIVTCVCRNVPAGWGEPVFGKTTSALAGAMLSIPATKGFEIGSGFAGAAMRGSEHNDMFIKKGNSLGTASNRSGGVQGGITNGEPIVFRVAFKPTATVKIAQETVDYDGSPVVLKMEKGRHDPCVVPRAVPVVEAMAALVLSDLALLA